MYQAYRSFRNSNTQRFEMEMNKAYNNQQLKSLNSSGNKENQTGRWNGNDVQSNN